MNINDTASLSFLDKCLQEILKQHPKDLHHLQFIVPSQRVGKHLLHSLVEQKKTIFFSPKIQTIPSLLTDISQLTIEKNHLKLLLFLYEIHCEIEAEKSYILDQFLPFGELLLADFNLIDQYNIDIKALFRDLKNYQELEGFLDSEWSFSASAQTEERPVWSFGQQEFSNFWDKLPHYYLKFKEKQEKEALFTQGLLTRKVAENMSKYVETIDAGQHFFFIGLNALSVSEQKIIHYLEKIGKATSFYNIDEYFLDQEAGSFFKKNQNNQTYSFVENLIQTESKHIEIIASTTQVQQAVEVGKILENIQFLPGKKAVLLGQESLVSLLLHYLPETVEVNISTGLPLQVSRAYTLVLKIFEISPHWHSPCSRDFFLFWITHPFFQMFINEKKLEDWKKQKKIQVYFLPEIQLLIYANDFSLAFLNALQAIAKAETDFEKVEKMSEFIFFLSEQMSDEHEKKALSLAQEVLLDILQTLDFHPLTNFSQNSPLHLKTYLRLFEKNSKEKTFDFLGDLFNGVQIMGILESRALDFDHLIFTSFEEDIFPKKKNVQSFIPLEIKKFHKIPTYIEQEALYAYYFYRLLMRSKNLYFLYNPIAGHVLSSGELSRFVAQIEEELPKKNKDIIWKKTALPTTLNTKKENHLILDNLAVQNIHQYLEKGISATAFCALLNCPHNFYFQYVLNCLKPQENSATIEQNTMGTIVHELLKDLYTPLLQLDEPKAVGIILKNKNNLNKIKDQIKILIEEKFNHFSAHLEKGKNALIFEISAAFLQKWLNYQIRQIEEKQLFWPILALEQQMYGHLNHTFPIKIVGNLDCISDAGEFYQIIDYKTAFIEQNKVNLPSDFSTLFERKNYERINAYPIQLLWYALLHHKNFPKIPIAAGIYSFQNLQAGLLQADKKNIIIQADILAEFEALVLQRIADFLSGKIPIVHSPKTEYCIFC